MRSCFAHFVRANNLDSWTEPLRGGERRSVIMSRSMRASANSLRNRAFSTSNSAAERAPGAAAPAFPLAATTQFANVPLEMASRFAASPCDNPYSNTNLTASARNSGVYCCSFLMIPPSRLVYQVGVSIFIRLPQAALRSSPAPAGHTNDLVGQRPDVLQEAEGCTATLDSPL